MPLGEPSWWSNKTIKKVLGSVNLEIVALTFK